MQARVIDLSHHNVVTSLKAAAAAGIWGLVHKASQGTAYADPAYAPHRRLAAQAGMLFGAYHFGTGDNVQAQVDHFLGTAQLGAGELAVLDFEPNRLSQMTVKQAVQFLHLVEQQLGRKAAIYSGSSLKESIGQLDPMSRDYLLQHRLWICQYGPVAKLPAGFKSKWLWQYSDGRVGPGPHGVAGIEGEVDLNAFDGTRAQLAASWA